MVGFGLGVCVYKFAFSGFFFFFFFLCAWIVISHDFIIQEKNTVHILFIYCSCTVHGSHETIHTFKNYFVTMFSNFNFSKNKFNPNIPLIQTYPCISIIYGGRNNMELEPNSWSDEMAWTMSPIRSMRNFGLKSQHIWIDKMGLRGSIRVRNGRSVGPIAWTGYCSVNELVQRKNPQPMSLIM